MNNIVDIEIYKLPCVILTDVHTKISNVQQLLNIYSDHQFICLGDITDLFNYNKDKANQNSIEFFSELKIPCLLGNHEQQLLSCETGNHLLTTKFDEASLLSINVDCGLTQQHLDFLRSLPRGFKLTLPNNKHYLCYHNRPQCLWSFTEPPIPKELFIEIIEKIQKQNEKDDKLSEVISDYTNSFFTCGDSLYLECLLKLLEDIIDPYEYISWWLYDSVNCEKIVWLKDGTEIKLDTLEQLYDFLINDIN